MVFIRLIMLVHLFGRPGEFVYIRLIMLVHLLGRPGEFVYIRLIMLVHLLGYAMWGPSGLIMHRLGGYRLGGYSLGGYSLGGYSLEVTDFGFDYAPSGRLQAGPHPICLRCLCQFCWNHWRVCSLLCVWFRYLCISVLV